MGSPLRERCGQGRRSQGKGTEGQEGVGGIDWCGGKSTVQTKSGTQREDGKEEHGGTRGELNRILEQIEDAVRSARANTST